MGITEFLEARIAEDESLAQSAINSHAPDEVWESELGSMNLWPEDIAFWASQTPYRVLAECAAKRAIVKQAEEASSDRAGVIHEYCVGDKERAEAYATDPGKLILEALSAVYKDHPDYRTEWAA